MSQSTATRRDALLRLAAFLPKAGHHYSAHRNLDKGAEHQDSVSGLSAYIRHRMITEREVMSAVLATHSPAQAEKFIQEVLWRAYFKGWLEHRPQVWARYRDDLRDAQAGLSGGNKSYHQAISGRTGISVFDAWAAELVATGYLHNHARMWFASIWVFTLKIPWVLGADFFLRHLCDGDPASNTLSWRWVAGLHTAGKTYLATKENIERFAGARFFQYGQPQGLDRLAGRAVALVEPPLPAPAMPQLPQLPVEAPAGGLLLTEEDLSLDVTFSPTGVCLFMPTDEALLPMAAGVRAFKDAAGRDALARAAVKWPAAQVTEIASAIAQVVDWVVEQQFDCLYVAYVPQGYIRDIFSELTQALSGVGCQLLYLMHDYDRLIWPHTAKGFFGLKRHIPGLLETLDLVRPEGVEPVNEQLEF